MLNTKPIIELPPLGHVCFVVKNVDQAIKHYESWGWGPWDIIEIPLKNFFYKGKIVPFARIKCAMLWGTRANEDIRLTRVPNYELMEVLEGECPQATFLREHGEGIHHIGFKVDSLQSVFDAFAKEGIKPSYLGDMPEYNNWVAYFDFSDNGGLWLDVNETYPKEDRQRIDDLLVKYTPL